MYRGDGEPDSCRFPLVYSALCSGILSGLFLIVHFAVMLFELFEAFHPLMMADVEPDETVGDIDQQGPGEVPDDRFSVIHFHTP